MLSTAALRRKFSKTTAAGVLSHSLDAIGGADSNTRLIRDVYGDFLELPASRSSTRCGTSIVDTLSSERLSEGIAHQLESLSDVNDHIRQPSQTKSLDLTVRS